VPVRDWYIPNRITLGIGGCWLLSYVLLQFDFSGADSLLTAIGSILSLLFIIQAIYGVTGRLRASGMTRVGHNLLILALLMFSPMTLQLLGAYRCLFGSQGIVTVGYKLYKQKRGDDDE